MASWKTAGPVGVHGFQYKKLSKRHGKIDTELQKTLESGTVPEWLMIKRTLLIMKDAKKGKVGTPTTNVEILTRILVEKILNHLFQNTLLLNDQKGCREESKDQLLIDNVFLWNCRRTFKGLAMNWIDYKKAYNMVPNSWRKEAMELAWLADNAKKLLLDDMERWKTILTANNQVLWEVSIKRGIFQRGTLSQLLFVIMLIPLSSILRKMECGYQLKSRSIMINHLLFMDNLKLYGKNERELNSLTNTGHIFSQT